MRILISARNTHHKCLGSSRRPTHRIGQTRPIFTYRLIARDTVEEKVLELQKTKRDLAAAMIGAENSMIRDLRSEDLALLLS